MSDDVIDSVVDQAHELFHTTNIQLDAKTEQLFATYRNNVKLLYEYIKLIWLNPNDSLVQHYQNLKSKLVIPTLQEAKKLDILMNMFAKRIYELNKTKQNMPQMHCDTIYMLLYSIIALEQNFTNKKILKKIKLDDFIKNNKGIDKGNDLPSSYISQIYHECKNLYEVRLKVQAYSTVQIQSIVHKDIQRPVYGIDQPEHKSCKCVIS